MALIYDAIILYSVFVLGTPRQGNSEQRNKG